MLALQLTSWQGVTQLTMSRNRKVAIPWFDSWCGNASLCPWERHVCFPSWGQAVYLLWWPSLTKDMQSEQLLCWSGITDIEHSTTTGSNEEEE